MIKPHPDHDPDRDPAHDQNGAFYYDFLQYLGKEILKPRVLRLVKESLRLVGFQDPAVVHEKDGFRDLAGDGALPRSARAVDGDPYSSFLFHGLILRIQSAAICFSPEAIPFLGQKESGKKVSPLPFLDSY